MGGEDDSRPKAILFDFGGTLCREHEVDVEAGAARILELASSPTRLTPGDLAEMIEESIADLLPRREVSQLELPPYTVERLVYEPNGLTFSQPRHEIELEFWQAATVFTVEPGIADALDHAGEQGVAMGVVSNTMFSARTLSFELRKHGLVHYFQFVMASSENVVRKPHPLIFRAAAARIGFEPSDIWFVGDLIEYDVRGSTVAGMTPVWYNPSGEAGTDPPALVLTHWSDLTEMLAPSS